MSLTSTWVARWRAAPSRPVLLDAADGAVLTGLEVDRATVALGVRLAAAGVRAGDRVVLSPAKIRASERVRPFMATPAAGD